MIGVDDNRDARWFWRERFHVAFVLMNVVCSMVCRNCTGNDRVRFWLAPDFNPHLIQLFRRAQIELSIAWYESYTRFLHTHRWYVFLHDRRFRVMAHPLRNVSDRRRFVVSLRLTKQKRSLR